MPSHFETTVAGRVLSLETGKLAGQAAGAVVVRYGDTIVLATAIASKEPRPGMDFFPMTVDFEERLYAAGKIPGGFPRREGRPSEMAILACRLTDRPLRPLFPKGFRNDVQVTITTLSTDQDNEPDVLAIIGASAALSISDIPFAGPVAAVRVGYLSDTLVVNPLASQMENSKLDLKVAGTKDAIMMVECGADSVSEELMLEALRLAHTEIQNIVALQEQLVAQVGKPKRTFTYFTPAADAKQAVDAFLADRLPAAINKVDKAERETALAEVQDAAVARFAEQFSHTDIIAVYESTEKRLLRNQILEKNIRPDGRDTLTVRPISCEVGMLPRVHGSGLFTRGQTQVLTIATLGSVADEQMIDGITLLESKRYIHHYNMPPFASGEARSSRGPGRREIGHGALAERALMPVIPSKDDFPYTLRLVSEVLSSNGSTSMAAVCGSTLALMDAGVPIKAPVAGVAMGLIMGDEGKYAILTDIQGMEDALGDMDFKVAGTEAGITALQMDIKIKGITPEIMAKALAQAHEGRMFILGKMLQSIDKSRPDISPYAPKIVRLKINSEKIGTVIGPGGKMIRAIQEEFKVKIDIEDDGSVTIATQAGGDADKAADRVRAITEEVEVGKIYLAKVVRIESFGAFVEVLPGKDALVRTPDLAEYPIARPEDAVKLGDEIMVMVLEVDSMGRANASRRAVLEGTAPGKATLTPRPPMRGSDGPRGGGFRGGGGGGFRGGDRRPSGPAPMHSGPLGGDRRPSTTGGFGRPASPPSTPSAPSAPRPESTDGDDSENPFGRRR
jgi:polyribonucleotide nucleotidyltransferase